MKIKYNYFLYLLCFVFIIMIFGCQDENYDYYRPKEFLFKYPNISFEINNDKLLRYDKYSSGSRINSCNFAKSIRNEIITFFIDDKQYELLLTNKYQKIGDTKYEVIVDCG